MKGTNVEHNTKLLGGVGYIVMIAFSVLGAVLPFAGIITLAAAICVVIAFVRAGDELGLTNVKQNIITAIVLYAVGLIVFAIVIGAGVTAMFATGEAGLRALGVGAIIGALIVWILSIVASWFWYKASISLAEGTNVALFKTGGLLLFIGAILLVVFGLGGILILIGEILQCVAFFNTRETVTS